MACCSVTGGEVLVIVNWDSWLYSVGSIIFDMEKHEASLEFQVGLHLNG